MKRRVVAIFIALVALASLVFAGSSGLPSFVSAPAEPREERVEAAPKRAKRDYVDMKSDEGWQMEYNGQKVMVVVGHFAAYHNGTVITADSAVRYNERHIECFGNVLIKRGTTYIYGDRAEYNGESSLAKVYSNIIKVVDGEATLWTYNFTFNTKTNIGRYSGGGVLISGDNILESQRGYVYTDTNEIVCVDNVQMRNNEYDMLSDSVVYNTETNFAQFFTRTNIWNKDQKATRAEDDYLYTDGGTYDKATQLYTLHKNGYILTKDQELMCDTLYYYRDSNYARLKRNIQIDDRVQKMLLFGDWGEYWKEPGNVFVTKNPSLISYDTTQSDSVFISSDSMYVNTRFPIREKIEKALKDSLERAAKAAEQGDAKGGVKQGSAPQSSAPQGGRAPMMGDEPTMGGPSVGRGAMPKGPQGAKRGERGGQTHPQKGKPTADKPAAPSKDIASEKGGSADVKSDSLTHKQDSVVLKRDSVAVKPKSKEELQRERVELRRKLIDSLASDTTKQGQRLRGRLLKAETADLNKAVKEALHQREAELRAKQAERMPLIKRLLGEAKVRDAERERIAKEREKFVKDSLKRAKLLARDSVKVDSVRLDSLKVDSLKLDSLKTKIDSIKVDSLRRDSVKVDSVKVDSLKADSTKLDTLAKFDSMTYKQVKAHFAAIADKERAEFERVKQDSLDAKLDRIGRARQAKRVEQYRKWAERDSIYLAKSREREFEQLRRKLQRQERRGIFVQMADSATLARVDSLLKAEFDPLDTLVNRQLDSMLEILFPKPVPSPAQVAKEEKENIDSFYRQIRAFRRVKIYRSDFQAVCDSLATTTIDSIIHMHHSPVMWNGANQITSEVTHIITAKSELVRADFEGKPLTASEIDTAHYNQVTGKEMTAHFRDRQMYRNDVKGNVQTIYYMQEEDSPEITLMAYIEAGDMTSYIEGQTVSGITYRGSPTYTFYPMDKIPETQPTKLPNFKWEANRRPTQDSIVTRTVRPSQRIVKQNLTRPLFPINALLQQRKADYIRRREWRDRTDTLTYETIEWIESLK